MITKYKKKKTANTKRKYLFIRKNGWKFIGKKIFTRD